MAVESLQDQRIRLIAGVNNEVLALVSLICVTAVSVLWRVHHDKRICREIASQNNCQPPTTRLQYKWPLALDVLKRGFRAGRQKKLLALLTDYFGQLGLTPEVTILGGTGYATRDPENIEAILSSQFDNFHLGHRSLAMKAMVGEGIFTQDGPAWKRSRELLRRQFARMQYKNLEGFREHVDNLIRKLRPLEGVVDLQPFFYRLTLHTTISMIFDQPVESFNHEVGDQFSKAFDQASLNTATRVRLGDLYFLYAPSGFFSACKTIKKYTYQFVKDALNQLDPRSEDLKDTTFISDLEREIKDLGLVRDQVINILIAGRDTTAATISYVIWLLTQNPRVLKKVCEEITSVVGKDDEITRGSIQKMPYLGQVLKEVLRLYPPVPLNSRFCKNTTFLPRGGGTDGQSPILVKKGMPVAYSVFHMQRREDLYGADALSFKPERWDDPQLEKIGWGYLPFNGGPRVCLGKDFGIMLASYTIIRVLQNFPEIRLAPGEAVQNYGEELQHLTLTLSNVSGCKVILQ